MHKLFSTLSLVAVLAAPVALHASTISGQFSADGDLINNGSSLQFQDAYTSRNAAAITGDFSTLLTTNEVINASQQTLNYSPYTSGSEVFTVGGLTITLESFMKNPSVSGMFTGTALLHAAGYDDTMANLALTTQDSGVVTFSATTTAVANSPVPEPSTLALLGTGGLGLAGAIRRRFAR